MAGKIPPEFQEYYESIRSEVEKEYRIAAEARRRIASPTTKVEVMFARDLAERVELLVGPKGVAEKIRKLFWKLSPEKLAFKLAEDIISEHRGKIEDEKLMLQVIRTSLAVLTPPCITAAPTEGIVDVKIKKNPDGSRYLAVYFAGPIRSAGGTELASVVVLADHVRKIIGLDRYRATQEEILRFLEEIRTYKRRVMRFQYNVPDNVLRFVLENLPVEVTGIATDRILTPSFRNLPRIETNYLRGGALRVVNDGIAGRAKKVLKLVEQLNLEGWEWIHEVVKMTKNRERRDEPSYFEEVVGGRPILSLPDRFGGLRIRYGRSFSTGMAAVGLHPTTLEVLQGYIVAGTQLKLDYPGKGGVVLPVDTIEPPTVLLRDGSVLRLDTPQKLEEARGKIEKILFLGDILISLGDLVENNVEFKPPGYCEEWWAEELRLKLAEKKENVKPYEKFIEDPLNNTPTVEEAVRISVKLGVPIHPRYLPYWRNALPEELEALRSWLRESLRNFSHEDGGALLPLSHQAKDTLTRLLVEHRVSKGRIVLPFTWLKSLIALLKPFSGSRLIGEDSIEAVERISGIPQRDKAGSFIGARMGRPEKAAQREMSPPVNLLFPVGVSGGNLRDLVTAANNNEKPVVELVLRRCPSCGAKTWKHICPECRIPTEIIGVCKSCGAENSYNENAICSKCGGEVIYYSKTIVNVGEELYRAARSIGESLPSRIKGVKGLSNLPRVPEQIEKGILRAKYGLYVYKDGTIRFDSTNAPLTHFTPRQVKTSVKKLRELGYTHDIHGKPLVSPDQILELKIQDIIISRKAAQHLLKVSKFIDDLLVKLAGMKPFYSMENPEDVVGKLVAALSPHTYAAVVARVVGIVDGLLCFAHPIFHAAKRRDCDGDEDSIMLLLDPLINFSRLYLPGKVGGKMDSPLLITITVYPEEVDEQAHNLDTCSRIPLEVYRAAQRGEHVSKVIQLIPTIKSTLGRAEAYGGTSYTHPQRDLVFHVSESSYKRYGTMLEKIMGQLRIAERLVAVDTAMVAERITETHILPDILGNAKAFFVQKFKCKRCGASYRRLPLGGRCWSCGGEVTQTVFRGAIEKYVQLTDQVLSKYVRDDYLKEHVEVTLENVRSIFGKTSEKGEGRQMSLEGFI